MKPFNITLIRPEGYLHAAALTEVAQYLHSCLVGAGYPSALTTNTIHPDAHNVVLCAHMLDKAFFDQLPPDTILFNSEQLRNKDRWHADSPYRQLLDKFFVWDYSLQNLSEIDHARKSHIAFFFCPDLARNKIPRKKDGLLFFYGLTTERRLLLIKEIDAAGVPVEILFGKYEAERDALIFGAWAVLNIGHTENLATFEPIRCFYPLINDIPVISETYAADPTFDIYKDWLFTFEPRDLAAGIAALHRDPAEFERQAADKLARFHKTSGVEAVVEAVDIYRRALNL